MAVAKYIALLGALSSTAACARGAKSPQDAYQRLTVAVRAHDAARLFDVLDQETRWSWMAVHRGRREAYDITLSNVPPGPDRDKELKRLDAAALAESARDLFVRTLPESTWPELLALLGGPAPREVEGRAETEMSGRKVVFRKDDRGWGFTGLAEAAEEQKRHALSELDNLRNAAADHERASLRRNR